MIAGVRGEVVSWSPTWAEDRATVGTDLSADPGAKTEGRAEDRSTFSARSSHPFGIGTKAINPSRRSRESASGEIRRGEQFDTEQRPMPGDGLPE
jgi:hypothetical protein